MATGLEDAAIAAAIKGGVLTLAKPVATATFSGLRSAASSIVDVFTNRLTEYVFQQHQRHSYLSTIVFQHQKTLHELYIPLTIVPAAEQQQERQSGTKIDRFPAKLLSDGSKMLITDTAGMGKSTLSKFLFLQCLASHRAIPFFIELRHLTDKLGVLDALTKQLNPPATEDNELRFPKKQVQRMLKKNTLIFFLDGYDEIQPAFRESVTKNLKELIELYPQHTYIITSRPESGLLAFPSFRQFNIKPLKPEESYELIRKYDEGGGRAEQLINTLKAGELRSVKEFLGNPLLCSLLYRSFEYKQRVPLKKHVFYRQVYDALYDWHDASKDGYNTREKRSGLDIDAFHRMLRVVGFYSVMKGEVEGDRDTVLGWIRTAKGVCQFNTLSESHFLEDLVKSVPVFVKDGDFYRWSHKSLSEYFAAQYICTEGKSEQKRTIDAIISSNDRMRFTNMLDQIYDIDNIAFREYLVLPAARDFTEYWNNHYRQLDPTIAESELALRRSATFDKKIVLFEKFEFENFKSFQAKLRSVEGLKIEEQVNHQALHLYMHEHMPILEIAGRHSLVFRILAAKKDPLVQRLELIDSVKTTRLPRIKTPIALSDDPNLAFNSAENFAKMTRVIMTLSPMPNAELLLRFSSEFKGLTRLTSLTDELLGSLRT